MQLVAFLGLGRTFFSRQSARADVWCGTVSTYILLTPASTARRKKKKLE